MSASSHTAEDIERELAELGEAPASDDELVWALEREHDDDDIDVAIVSRLAELATPGEYAPLSEIESRRVWRNVEQRSGRAVTDQSSQANQQANQAGHRPSGGGPRRWLFAAAGLAAAAAAVIIVIGPGERGQTIEVEPPPSAEQVAELGEQVRAQLQALDDGKSDTARATELADAYQQRLAAQQERGG